MTKDDFKRIPELRKLIHSEWILSENAMGQATNITAHINGMPHGSGSVGSMIENAVIRKQTHFDKYCAYRLELDGIFARLDRESVRLTGPQKEVVDMYYVKNKRIADIAKKLSVTDRHVFRLKKEGVAALCSFGS